MALGFIKLVADLVKILRSVIINTIHFVINHNGLAITRSSSRVSPALSRSQNSVLTDKNK